MLLPSHERDPKISLHEHGRVRAEVVFVNVTEVLVILLHNISHEDRYVRTIPRNSDLQVN